MYSYNPCTPIRECGHSGGDAAICRRDESSASRFEQCIGQQSRARFVSAEDNGNGSIAIEYSNTNRFGRKSKAYVRVECDRNEMRAGGRLELVSAAASRSSSGALFRSAPSVVLRLLTRYACAPSSPPPSTTTSAQPSEDVCCPGPGLRKPEPPDGKTKTAGRSSGLSLDGLNSLVPLILSISILIGLVLCIVCCVICFFNGKNEVDVEPLPPPPPNPDPNETSLRTEILQDPSYLNSNALAGFPQYTAANTNTVPYNWAGETSTLPSEVRPVFAPQTARRGYRNRSVRPANHSTTAGRIPRGTGRIPDEMTPPSYDSVMRMKELEIMQTAERY